MATTPGAIRDAFIDGITGIAPALHPQQRFKVHREELPFRDWAEKNASACLRRFSVRFTGNTEPPLVNDLLVQEVQDIAEVIVAYPTDWRHGGDQLAGLDNVIDLDGVKIERTIGPPGYATTAGLVAPCTVLWQQANERESLGAVTLLIIRYRVDYTRAL